MTKKPRPRKKSILAVDDDGLVRRSLEIFLKEAGYEAVVVKSGTEAIEALGRKRFDLFITDIRMPGMDGLQVIQAVREYCRQKKLPEIPEIVLTAYNDEPVKDAALRMDVRDFILKPFRIDEFLRVLERSFV